MIAHGEFFVQMAEKFPCKLSESQGRGITYYGDMGFWGEKLSRFNLIEVALSL